MIQSLFIATKILPDTGRGTIRGRGEGHGRSSVRLRRIYPSVSASRCHLPQTSWGRILELRLSRIILPELVSGRGTAAAGGGGGAFDV